MSRKKMCMDCEEKRHFVESSGSFLCKPCFDKQVDKLKNKYGEKTSHKTTKQVINEYIEKAKRNGIVLKAGSIKWRMHAGWDEEDIINVPPNKKRKTYAG